MLMLARSRRAGLPTANNVSDFLYPVPTNKPADEPLYVCGFNVDWLPLILDVVDNLQYSDLFDSPPDDITQQVQELLDQLMTPIIISPQAYPSTAWHMHRYSVTLVGNAIAFAAGASTPLGGYWRQSAAALGDQFTFPVFLDAGTYDLFFNWQRSTNSGILTLFLDNAVNPFATKDLYGTSLADQTAQETLSISEPGLHTITGKVNSKNASSSGYVAFLQDFYFLKLF